MKIKARTNGNIVDLPSEAARKLIELGIYDAVDTPKDDPPAPPRRKAPR